LRKNVSSNNCLVPHRASRAEAGRLTSTDNNITPNLPRVILTDFYNAASWRFGLSSNVNSTADFSNIYNYDNIGRMFDLQQYGIGVAQKRVDITYNQSGQYGKITRSSTTGAITEARCRAW